MSAPKLVAIVLPEKDWRDLKVMLRLCMLLEAEAAAVATKKNDIRTAELFEQGKDRHFALFRRVLAAAGTGQKSDA